MRHYLVTPLLLLLAGGCLGPSAETIEKALKVNAAQRAVFESQADAFRWVVLNARFNDEAMRKQILDAIRQDASAFYASNTSLSAFVMAFGELDPNDVDRFLDATVGVVSHLREQGEAEALGASTSN